MLDYQDFLRRHRACLIAPAGYGKTYSIVGCLKNVTGKQLVVTHTHAGVAALREKIKNAGIPHSRYDLETISSLSQKIAQSFTTPEKVPQKDKADEYFPWILKRSVELAGVESVRRIFSLTYDGVIVDEYQDCSLAQHRLLLRIAEGLPMRIFGDPLQGIFDFDKNSRLVDFQKDLNEFDVFRLDVPRRWEKTNPALGKEIAMIRTKLERGEKIVHADYKEIRFYHEAPQTIHKKLMDVCREIGGSGETLVVATNKNARIAIAQCFGGRCRVVEAIDDAEFYDMPPLADSLNKENCYSTFYRIAERVFFKGDISNWITEHAVISKKSEADKALSHALTLAVDAFRAAPSVDGLRCCLVELANVAGVRLLCHEKYHSYIAAMKLAAISQCSVVEAMCRYRDKIRIVGRHKYWFSVGTTYLTKGLEFENVVVADYNKEFDLSTVRGRRNFYVAVSRACKTLAILRYDRKSFFGQWVSAARRS